MVNQTTDLTIGERITYARKARCLSQKHLAELIDTSPQQINRWEKGRRNPKLATLNKISKALNINEGYFYSDRIRSEGLEYYLSDFAKDGKKNCTINKDDYINVINSLLPLLTDEEIKEIYIGVVRNYF